MNRIHAVALLITAVLILLDLIAVGFILVRKLLVVFRERRSADIARQLVEEFPEMDDAAVLKRYRSRGSRFMLLDQYVEVRQSLRVQRDLAERIRRLLVQLGIERFYLRRLSSPFRLRRIEAAVYLGNLGGETACARLERQLGCEKKYLVKLYTAYALCEIGEQRSVVPLIESLIDAPEWYQEKVRLFIGEFGMHLHRVLPELVTRTEPELRLLCAHLAYANADSLLHE